MKKIAIYGIRVESFWIYFSLFSQLAVMYEGFHCWWKGGLTVKIKGTVGHHGWRRKEILDLYTSEKAPNTHLKASEIIKSVMII